jgi:hypothetical protein
MKKISYLSKYLLHGTGVLSLVTAFHGGAYAAASMEAFQLEVAAPTHLGRAFTPSPQPGEDHKMQNILGISRERYLQLRGTVEMYKKRSGGQDLETAMAQIEMVTKRTEQLVNAEAFVLQGILTYIETPHQANCDELIAAIANSCFPDSLARVHLKKVWRHYYAGDRELTDDQAYNLLLAISRDKDVSVDQRAEADLLAGVRYSHNIPGHTIDEADALLLAVSKNEEFSLAKRAQANFTIAKACYEKISKALTDEQAYDLLVKVCQYIALGYYGMHANLMRAKMHYDGRTKELTDEEAYDLLLDVSKNRRYCPHLANEADFIRARIRYSKRIEALTDEEAYDLLVKVSQDRSKFSSALSDLIRVQMHYDGRTKALTDGQAHALLLAIKQNADLSRYHAEVDLMSRKIRERRR